ncbi:hypothetical protein [Mucisphaera sp.]|uniref:hypothetical protein n=1 Tax=Mucisphaera sp. TaxID=2913024 RepID=UPI003D0B0672
MADTGEATPQPNQPTRSAGSTWKILLAAILVIAAGVLLWEEVLEDRIVAKRLGEVVPGEVYRSGQISPYLIEDVLRNKQIDVVIDFTGIPDSGMTPEQQAEAQAIAKLGIEGHRFPLAGDGTGNIESYVSALTVLHQARIDEKQVLMHCAAGSQRTGAATGFYRLLFEDWMPDQVIEEMKSYDWHPTKDAILIDYMNQHMATLVARLAEEGVLLRIPETLPVMPGGIQLADGTAD